MPELTLKKYIKLLGIKMHNKKPWSIADKSKWRKIILPMVKKGMLYKDIAKAVGSSTSVVYLWCVRNEIDRKTILANCWTNNKTNEKNKRPA
jgi:transposase